MNKSTVSEWELQAYLDHRLPPTRLPDVEQYLARYPEESKRLAAYRAQDVALHNLYDPVLDEPIPRRLLRRRWYPARYAAAVAWLTLGIAFGWGVHDFGNEGGLGAIPGWVDRAAIAHAVYAPDVRHPVEVGAENEAQLVSWLSKRLGPKLRVPQLKALGYELLGGRLLPGESGPAAQFMYQDGTGQRLTLYVRTVGKDAAQTAFRYTRERDIGVFYWIDDECGYALTGRFDKAELLRVTKEVYRQLDS